MLKNGQGRRSCHNGTTKLSDKFLSDLQSPFFPDPQAPLMDPRTQAQEVASKIEAELKRTGLKPGWRLPPEEQLATSHGVSRGVLRAALAILRERGILVSRRGGGTFMSSLDAAEVTAPLAEYAKRTALARTFDELMDLRILIEGECARALANSHGKEAFNRLEDAFAVMRRCSDAPKEFALADYEFHRVLVRESGNALFHAILEALRGVFEEYSMHAHTAILGRRDRTIAEHEAILDAIRSGDADAAAHLASAHVRRAKSSMIAAREKAP